jgi:aryl-alcohol dehydrogenase-like predicted oxidoreductase
VEELKQIVPAGKSLATLALKWILDFDAVSTVIPGASKPEQVTRNLEALNETSLSSDQLQQVQDVYEKYIKQAVHHLW